MTDVLLACRDLMTSSRLELADGVRVRRFSDPQRLLDALGEAGDCVVVVDLTCAAELPASIRGRSGGERVPIVAFAPHVQEELLDAAREHADLVVPRGSVMQGLQRQVRRAIELRGNETPRHPR